MFEVFKEVEMEIVSMFKCYQGAYKRRLRMAALHLRVITTRQKMSSEIEVELNINIELRKTLKWKSSARNSNLCLRSAVKRELRMIITVSITEVYSRIIIARK